MKAQGRIVGEVNFTARGEAILSLAVDNKPAALDAYNHLNGKAVDIEIKQHKERRTLDQNAYFHVLVNAIARKMHGVSDDAVKYNLVTQYGVLATDGNGNKVAVKLPSSVDPASVGLEYAVPYKTVMDGKTETVCYKIYQQTRYYDTAEMNALIDGAIYEAQQLGVITDTPEEIAKMKSLWATERGK